MRNVQSSHVLQSGGGSGNDAEWPRSHSWDNALRRRIWRQSWQQPAGPGCCQMRRATTLRRCKYEPSSCPQARGDPGPQVVTARDVNHSVVVGV